MAAQHIYLVINREDGSILAWNGDNKETSDMVVKKLHDSGYNQSILFLSPDDPIDEKLAKFAELDKEIAPTKVDTIDISTRVRELLDGAKREDTQTNLVAGELELDQDTCQVRIGDAAVDLSPTEFKLLRYLMLNPNRVISKSQILDYVWEYDFNGDAGIVESYISYLRKKVEVHTQKTFIQTRRGFGYMLKTR